MLFFSVLVVIWCNFSACFKHQGILKTCQHQLAEVLLPATATTTCTPQPSTQHTVSGVCYNCWSRNILNLFTGSFPCLFFTSNVASVGYLNIHSTGFCRTLKTCQPQPELPRRCWTTTLARRCLQHCYNFWSRNILNRFTGSSLPCLVLHFQCRHCGIS